MQSKEVLKFEIFTPLAVFKTPFSVKGIETFPLPPYSTVIGLLYTALGRKYNGEKFSISVKGDYELLFRDYLTFRKYNKDKKKLETKPIEVPFLYHFRLTCHILGEAEILNLFEEALKKPKTYLSLGLRDIPAKVLGVKRLPYEFKELERSLSLEKNAFVPKKLFEKMKTRSRYGRLEFTHLGGIEFTVPSFIRQLKPYRDYHFEEVVFLPKGFRLQRGSLIHIDGEGECFFPTEETNETA